MSGPLKCCPHCDADLAPGRGASELCPCWLCRKPMTPAAPRFPRPAALGPVPPAPRPGSLVATAADILKWTLVAILAFAAIPIALLLALGVVCAAIIPGASVLDIVGDLSKGFWSSEMGVVLLGIAIAVVILHWVDWK